MSNDLLDIAEKIEKGSDDQNLKGCSDLFAQNKQGISTFLTQLSTLRKQHKSDNPPKKRSPKKPKNEPSKRKHQLELNVKNFLVDYTNNAFEQLKMIKNEQDRFQTAIQWLETPTVSRDELQKINDLVVKLSRSSRRASRQNSRQAQQAISSQRSNAASLQSSKTASPQSSNTASPQSSKTASPQSSNTASPQSSKTAKPSSLGPPSYLKNFEEAIERFKKTRIGAELPAAKRTTQKVQSEPPPSVAVLPVTEAPSSDSSDVESSSSGVESSLSDVESSSSGVESQGSSSGVESQGITGMPDPSTLPNMPLEKVTQEPGNPYNLRPRLSKS